MPTHRPKLFLSYARDDDASFVGGLYGDLRSRGFSVWWDRASMPSRALTFLQEIRDAVDACDRLIIVLGPRAVTSDYVRAEWQYALVASKVVIPILRVGTYDLLPAELTNLHCPDVRDTRAYPDALAELMRILDDPVPPLASLSGVPAAPPHFQPRPDDLTRLAAAVLLDLRRPGVVADGARSTVLHGMAGVGKSVLAAAFARSTEVRRAFSDGVFWLRIGPRPDWSTALATLRASLPGGTALGWDLDSARSRLAPLLEGRSCLIVLDDLWDVTHAEPFTSAMGPRCRVLVTSRDGGLVTALGAVPVPLDLLSEDAALRHLADWSGAPTGSLPPVARAVAEECGRLPLAIALCGALARDGVPWVDLHAALREADLAFVEKQFPNYPYPNLLRSLQVSMEALARMDPEAARRYGELVVFAPGVAVPEAAVLTLWLRANGSTERDARKVLSTLAQKALLRCDGTAPRRAVVLHDLQYDYLHASRPGLTALHQELVEAYRRMSPGGWTTSPDDGYWRARLSYHLSAADRWDELCALLTETPEWLEAQFRGRSQVIAASLRANEVLGVRDGEVLDGNGTRVGLWTERGRGSRSRAAGTRRRDACGGGGGSRLLREDRATAAPVHRWVQIASAPPCAAAAVVSGARRDFARTAREGLQSRHCGAARPRAVHRVTGHRGQWRETPLSGLARR
jgi:hypothetical protein